MDASHLNSVILYASVAYNRGCADAMKAIDKRTIDEKEYVYAAGGSVSSTHVHPRQSYPRDAT